MKVYLDLLFLLNWWIDFFLLLIVKLLLKRITSIIKLLIASFVGAWTTFIVFLNISSVYLFIIKLFMSLLIVILSFGYKDSYYTIKNVLYLLMNGIILGGISYLIKINIMNKYCYLVLMVLLTPLMLYFFYKQNSSLKRNYNLYFPVEISIGSIKNIKINGFLDSGNSLRDPITQKPIILVNQKRLKGINRIRSPMYVPIKTVSSDDLIKCYKPDLLKVNNKEYKNYLIGIVNNNFNKDGVDCLLNNSLLEDL